MNAKPPKPSYAAGASVAGGMLIGCGGLLALVALTFIAIAVKVDEQRCGAINNNVCGEGSALLTFLGIAFVLPLVATLALAGWVIIARARRADRRRAWPADDESDTPSAVRSAGE